MPNYDYDFISGIYFIVLGSIEVHDSWAWSRERVLPSRRSKQQNPGFEQIFCG